MTITRAPSAGPLPRICVFSYKTLSPLIRSIARDYEGRASIEVVNEVFDRALEAARERERQRRNDVFVSAGANASLLRSALATPVVTIKVSGYDVWVALLQAREFSERVGIVTYGNTIPELQAMKDLLKLEITQKTYHTVTEQRQRFMELMAENYQVVIGSSVVVDLARQHGIHGILAYSDTAVRQAFDDAIELARATAVEAARYDLVNGVLHHLQEAVVAVDIHERITAINPAMEATLGLQRDSVLGKTLSEVVPELTLRPVLDSGEEELAQVTVLKQTTIVSNRIPVRENGEVTGAVLTLQPAHFIERADVNIRVKKRACQIKLSARYRFSQLLGNSPALAQARATGERYAKTNSTVLLTGESGTGKELFAQSIHNASARRSNPFLAVNCAAFPEPLLESELFGYEEGAFTGSRKGGKPGLFEVAHTGTVFLDEIGDMPVSLQSRLLRVLQEKEVTRIGSAQPIPVDIRIIAATHQPLNQRVELGLFRSDLYYRLNILHLRLPSLRERPEDIPLLALHLLYAALRRIGSSLPADQALAPVMPQLRAYSWPGNVRELENIAERLAVYLSQYSTLSDNVYQGLPSDFPELWPTAPAPAVATHPVVDSALPEEEISDGMLMSALERARGNRQEVARLFGLSRTTVWRRLKAMSQRNVSGRVEAKTAGPSHGNGNGKRSLSPTKTTM